MSAVTRADIQRRQGTLGEIDTVRERLERVEWLLGRRQVLLWGSVGWWVEQVRRQATRVPARLQAPLVRAIDALDNHLAEIDALLVEARAETAGALRHLDNVVPAVRIDQYLADRYRLHEAGLDDGQLDAVVNSPQRLEAAS